MAADIAAGTPAAAAAVHGGVQAHSDIERVRAASSHQSAGIVGGIAANPGSLKIHAIFQFHYFLLLYFTTTKNT